MAHILVIDDDDSTRFLLRKFLERNGHKVTEAANGDAGVTAFNHEPADVILTDILMPEKEGLETIIELKRSDPEVKIIALSGGGERGNMSYLAIAQKLGAWRTFAKPFDLSELQMAIDELLATHSVDDAGN